MAKSMPSWPMQRCRCVDGDSVEFLGNAARRLDLAGHQLAKVLEMHMAGHEFG